MNTYNNTVKRVVSFLAFVIVSAHSAAQSSATPDDLEEAWSALERGEAVVLMRHALAPGTGDPVEFDVEDCSTQRNLSDQGRTQAESIGDTFRKNGIDTANVLSSYWCRCVDTAELLELGEVTRTDALNSFFEDRFNQQKFTSAAREKIVALLGKPMGKPMGKPTVMVTHQVNITALTGQSVQSGEMKIVILENDKLKVLASVPTE